MESHNRVFPVGISFFAMTLGGALGIPLSGLTLALGLGNVQAETSGTDTIA